MTPITTVPPYSSFEEASRAVLEQLHQLVGFELWMMTRTEGDHWVVLHTEDHGYNIGDGTVLKWSDSFCSRMIRGEGPCVAPNANAVVAYANAPIGQQVEIGAYVGIPIHRKNGELFGTLCAISPEQKPEYIENYLGIIQVYGRLLATVLEQELQAVEQARALTVALENAHTDVLTGIANRRAWDVRVEAEELRASRYGDAICVIIIDLNEMKAVNDSEGHCAGDDYLVHSASVLRNHLRATDFIARIGGDEFGVILSNTSRHQGEVVLGSLKEACSQHGVSASFGLAERDHSLTIDDAIRVADTRMYQDKDRQKLANAK